MKRVLILCTGNSCRSQMAEGLWNHLAEGLWQAESAGSQPSGYVHPLAIRVMAEWRIDISQQLSKSVDDCLDRSFDLVVTVCDGAREACPIFPQDITILHWPFEDPANASGTESERLTVFRSVRDRMRQQIEQYLKQPS